MFFIIFNIVFTENLGEVLEKGNLKFTMQSDLLFHFNQNVTVRMVAAY